MTLYSGHRAHSQRRLCARWLPRSPTLAYGLARFADAGRAAFRLWVTPDPAKGYPQACVAVTIDNGPPDTYRLLVAVLTGTAAPRRLRRGSSPLRRWSTRCASPSASGEFDPFHKGTITFTVEALNRSDDAIGYLKQAVSIQSYEHTQATVSLGQLPDMAEAPISRRLQRRIWLVRSRPSIWCLCQRCRELVSLAPTLNRARRRLDSYQVAGRHTGERASTRFATGFIKDLRL